MHNKLNFAIELREAGKYQEAQQCIHRFIAKYPDDPEALSLLSHVFMLDKKNALAEQALSKAISINAELPSIHRNHARLLLSKSKPAEALQMMLSGYKQSSDDPEDWLVLAACLGANQKDQEAVHFIEKALHVIPNFPEAFANRAVIRLRAKDIIGAIQDAEKSVSIKPHLTHIWALLAHLRYLNKNLTGAIEAANKAFELEPTNVNLILNLGDFLRQAGKLPEAISKLEKATVLAPNNPNTWTSLGLSFQQANKNDSAKSAYGKALAINPQAADIWSNLGSMAGDSKDWQSALQNFEHSLAVNPNIAEVHDNMGIAQQNLGRLDDAEASHKKAITLRADYTEAHNNLGNVFKKLGKLQDAQASFRNAIALKPDHADAYNNLGSVLISIGKVEQAETNFRQAIALNPNNAETHSNLGTALKALGRFEQAKASFKQAIALKPDCAEFYTSLGNILKNLDIREEAEACYMQAIKLQPESASAHYNLGMFLLAVKEYKRATEYLKFSNFEKSEHYLLRCLYLLNEKSLFFEQLDYLIKQGEIHPIIGSLGNRSAQKYGIERQNLFCRNPLDYVLKVNLNNQYDFGKTFITTARSILNEKLLPKKRQGILINGYQTNGNVFDLKSASTDEMQKIILLEIAKYRNNFKNSTEGLFTSWPTDYSLNGWFICMKSGGELQAHMHEKSWLSGSIYINVPPKSKVESGNLVVTIEDERLTCENKNRRQSIDVLTGNLCLFPASLLHYTIPFESEEERIVLAFDVVPMAKAENQ